MEDGSGQGSSEHVRAIETAAAGRVDEAMAICNEALARDPHAAWPHEVLGYLLHRRGDMPGAIRALEAACDRPDPKAALLHALGRLYYRSGAFPKAIDSLGRAVRLEPDRGESHYLLGLAQFHAGLTRDSIESFDLSAQLDPSNVIACYHLAMAHSRAGNLRAAIRCLERVVASGTEAAAAHYHLGVAHYALGEMSDAARHFARSIEIDPSDDRSRRMFQMVGERLGRSRPADAARGLRRIARLPRADLVAKIAVVTVAVFVTAGGGLAAWLVKSAERDDMDVARARAEAVAAAVRHALQVGADPGGESRVQEMVESLGTEPDIVSIKVMSKAGVVVASTDRAEVGARVSPSAEGCRSCHAGGGAPHGRWLEFREAPAAAGGRALALVRPLYATADAGRGGTASGVPLGMLEMTISLAEIDARRSDRRARAIVIGVSTCVGLLAVVIAIVWRLVRRPLAQLEAAVGRVASGELDTEVPADREDEVGRLMAAFNRMTRELRRGRDEVDEINRGMERRIEEATARLQGANRELEEANRKLVEFDGRKSEYVQKAVHDLRSPLAAVLLTLRNVRDGLLGSVPDPQMDALGRATARAEHMARLVSDLLDLEQLRSAPARPVRESVRVGVVFSRSVEAIRPRIDERRVAVETSGLDDLPAVSGDPAAIESVAGNLVDNAVKYTRAGGLVRVAGRVEDGWAVVEVADTGIGIPAGEMPLLFTEFFRAGNARAREKEGTGLGLAIVKRIVEAHGGTVSVRSEEGVGSTFTVRLPVAG